MERRYRAPLTKPCWSIRHAHTLGGVPFNCVTHKITSGASRERRRFPDGISRLSSPLPLSNWRGRERERESNRERARERESRQRGRRRTNESETVRGRQEKEREIE